jgi:hypothetical protein
MNTTLVRQLSAALRSGQYAQGRHQLKTIGPDHPPAYCCLGVACDLYAADHPEARWLTGNQDDERWGAAPFFDGADQSATVLPALVQHAYGFGTSGGPPVVIDGDWCESLSSANDRGYDFDEIADALDVLCDREETDARHLGDADRAEGADSGGTEAAETAQGI